VDLTAELDLDAVDRLAVDLGDLEVFAVVLALVERGGLAGLAVGSCGLRSVVSFGSSCACCSSRTVRSRSVSVAVVMRAASFLSGG
jgi:hypothetical protein